MLIDHIGIAVRSIEDGIEQWVTFFGYSQATEVVLNTRQMVYVVFMEKENSLTIKLISPSDEKSPIYAFAKRGGGLHHICFKCDHLGNTIEDLKSHGSRLIAAPEPGEAFDNNLIAFMFAKNGLNVELIDTTHKAGRIKG